MPCRGPSQYNIANVLPKLAKEKTLEFALHSHVVASERGLETDLSSANYLISLFTDSSRMCYAQQVFDKLSYPDPKSWNALILGHSRHGDSQQALKIFHKTHIAHLNEYAFVALLKASTCLNDLTTGMAIHSCVTGRGLLEENPYIGSALIDMYAKCGSINEARQVFDMLWVKDTVCWTALLAGNVECGFNAEALYFFEKMLSEGIQPDAFSCASSLKACGRLYDVAKGRALHADIIERGFEATDAFIGSSLVDMYARCGSLSEAFAVFIKLQSRDVVSWTALITGLVECRFTDAICVVIMMHQDGISPTIVTFVCTLNSCAALGAIDLGLEVHIEIVKRGSERELIISNSLIDMYAKCGFLEEARQGFDKLSVRNVVSCNALLAGYVGQERNEDFFLISEKMECEGISPNSITFTITLRACSNTKALSRGQQIHIEIMKRGLLVKEECVVGNALIDMYVKCGLLDNARKVFSRLATKDVISWTTIIQGYAEYGGEEEALRYFQQMEQVGIAPSVVTFVSILKACGTMGAMVKGLEIHTQIAKKGLEGELLIGNCFVYLYSKCGMLAAAEHMFYKLQARDIVSCNALITGYAQLGESVKVFRLFNRMIDEKIQPDSVTFVCVLNACSHEGEVEKGQIFFEAMTKYCSLDPSLNHYACMIDLFGRSGHMDAAKVIISRMPLQPGMVEWHTLMSSCRKWGDVELATHGFMQVMQLDEIDDCAYLYMFNIYVDADMLEEASQVDALRQLNWKWNYRFLMGTL